MNSLAAKLRLGLLLLGLVLGIGCGGEEPEPGGKERAAEAPLAAPEQPSIVLISIDTLRSDRLPAYGYRGVETPAIDSLVADGILFENAYSHVPLTMPAHASILTGLLPPEHGVRDNLGYRLRADLPYLPRLLQQEGYATGGAVSAFVLRAVDGLGSGFDLYDDHIAARDRAGLGGVQRPASETLERLLPWLDSVGDRPFFLFFHLFEPHTPYAPPEPFRSRYSDPYDGEIATADAVVGRLLASLRQRGLYQDTAILLLSDHGEGLGDHGEQEHGLLLYRESLQVPLILKLPAAKGAGRRVARAAQLIDVFPTLASLAGIETPAELRGLSLLQLADAPPEPRAIYAETFFPRLHFGWSELSAVFEAPWQYIHGPDPELYDLHQDPGQRVDLIDRQRRDAKRLRQTLSSFQATFAPPQAVDSETRQALASLGYAGRVGRGEGDEALADPKSRLGTLDDLKEGLRAYQEGRFSDAVGRYRKAVRSNPRSLDAWEYLGRSLSALGQIDEALAATLQALELGKESNLAIVAARMLLQLGRPEEALPLLRRQAEQDPGEPRLRLLEARTLLLMGRADDAWATADRLHRSAPKYADALYLRGSIEIARRNFSAAETDLRQALALAPEHTAAMGDLAALLQHLGKIDQARSLLQRLLALRPGDPAATRALESLSRSPGR